MTALRRVKRTVLELRCERCGYEWVMFKEPERCGKCKSKYWNIPKGKLPIGRPKSR